MSAKRAPQPAEDDAEEWDPHDIVPDSFDYDTLAEAERAAEADQFELDSRKRCPQCKGTRIRLKVDTVAEQPNRRDGRYICANGHHFDDPLPSVNEAVGEQVTLSEVRKR